MKKIIYTTLVLGALTSCGQASSGEAVETMSTGRILLEIATENPVQAEILRENQSLFQDMGYDLSIIPEEGDFGEEGVLVYYNPMGLYSVHFDENIPDGAIIALPQENQNEALLLLEEAGLISLAGMSPFDLDDVEANYFDLVLMEAEQPVDLIEQVDYVVDSGEKAWSSAMPPALYQGRYGAVYVEDEILATVLIGEELQDFLAQRFQGYLLPVS